MLKKDYLAAKDMFQAGEIILPENAWASYLVATAHAQLGEKKQAIQELKKALEKGMTNPKALEDAAFDRISGEEGFKQIAEKLSAIPKHHLRDSEQICQPDSNKIFRNCDHRVFDLQGFDQFLAGI